MRKMCRFIFFIFSFFVFRIGAAQITITVTDFPALPDSVADTGIYIAGNFNNWDPGNQQYKLKKQNEKYSITFTPESVTNLEFKFTRGSWQTGETLKNGGFKENRGYYYHPGMTVEEKIENWEDLVPHVAKIPNADVIQFSVYAPQLKKEKTIRVYLPCDYKTSVKIYPVFYMLDGQNLFDDVYSFAGEWGIDESMDSICKTKYPDAIIVGIDHGGAERNNEYSPWVNAQYGGGKGDAFAEFVVKTLKPHIDSVYRTLPDRENTAIGGSSMGGLMSFYFVTQYNSVFSKALIFSPAFWFANENFEEAQNYTSSLPTKMYFICGGLEGDQYMNDMISIFTMVKNKNLPGHTFRLSVESDAKHTESFWRKEFIEAYEWLFE